MPAWLTLLGLVLEMTGVGLLIRDELTPLAARIKQSQAQPAGGFCRAVAFWLAQRFGSSNPLDQESYVGESFPTRLCGFFLLLLGFVAQAVAVVIYVSSAQSMVK